MKAQEAEKKMPPLGPQEILWEKREDSEEMSGEGLALW